MTFLDKNLIPFYILGEEIIFYYKVEGGYYRYLAEFKTNRERKDFVDHSLKAYEAASAIAKLPPTHSIRLGLAFNFYAFY